MAQPRPGLVGMCLASSLATDVTPSHAGGTRVTSTRETNTLTGWKHTMKEKLVRLFWS